MNSISRSPLAPSVISFENKLSLGFHFIPLSFTTATLLVSLVIQGGEVVLFGYLGLLLVGFMQLLSALFGALLYRRSWQKAHLLASLAFVGLQVLCIALVEQWVSGRLPEVLVWSWVIGGTLLSLAAGWSYWYNLRRSYWKEDAESLAEQTII